MSSFTTEDITFQTIFQYFGFSLKYAGQYFIKAELSWSEKGYYIFIDVTTDLPKCYSLAEQNSISKLSLLVNLSEKFPSKERINGFVQDISYLKNQLTEQTLTPIKPEQVLTLILKISTTLLPQKYADHPLADQLFKSSDYPDHLLLLNKSKTINFLVFSNIHHNYSSFPEDLSHIQLSNNLPGPINIYFSPKTFLEHSSINGIKNYLLLGSAYFKNNNEVMQLIVNPEHKIIINDQSVQELSAFMELLTYIVNDRILDTIQTNTSRGKHLLIFSNKSETPVSRSVKISSMIKIDSIELKVDLSDTFESDVYEANQFILSKIESASKVTNIEVPDRAYLLKAIIDNIVSLYKLADHLNVQFYPIERDIDTNLPDSLIDSFI